VRGVKAFVVGAVTFIALHLLFVATWHRWFSGGDGLDPWFMNSGSAVAITAIAFGVAGLVSSRLTSNEDLDSRVASAAVIATGGALPMVFVLFTMRGGPGNLFPIVIFVGWWVMCLGAMAGAGAAWLLRRIRGAGADQSARSDRR
jgi:hypothetical protein